MEGQKEENVSFRILQLKNNFYWDKGSPGKEALGEYCVLGYFDAIDIFPKKQEDVTESNTWKYLGQLTAQLDGTANCRMLICVTEQKGKDEVFWKEPSEALFFVTMVRVDKEKITADELKDIIEKIGAQQNQIGYLSYDHSEIIVVTKTNKYSDGIWEVKKLRQICGALKTYTISAMLEKELESYETIHDKLEEETVSYRLHCMVKDYDKAEGFRKKLEGHMSDRNGKGIEIRKFETFGGCDWLLEIDDISICSIFECYKTGELLTHSNKEYNEAFFNIESEILVRESKPEDIVKISAELKQ